MHPNYYIADETNIYKYKAENIGTLMEFRDLANENTFAYDEARLIENIYLKLLLF